MGRPSICATPASAAQVVWQGPHDSGQAHSRNSDSRILVCPKTLTARASSGKPQGNRRMDVKRGAGLQHSIKGQASIGTTVYRHLAFNSSIVPL